MNKTSTWLFNPFHYVAGGKALGLGCVLLAVSALFASIIDVRFMGILNLHVGTTSLLQAILDLVVNIGSMVLLLWISAFILSKSRFRMLDLLGTQMLARCPLQFAGLMLGLLPSMQDVSSRFSVLRPSEALATISTMELTTLIASALAILMVDLWTITLMYNSYRVSCNLKGMRSGISFCIVILIAAPLSSLLLYAITSN